MGGDAVPVLQRLVEEMRVDHHHSSSSSSSSTCAPLDAWQSVVTHLSLDARSLEQEASARAHAIASRLDSTRQAFRNDDTSNASSSSSSSSSPSSSSSSSSSSSLVEQQDALTIEEEALFQESMRIERDQVRSALEELGRRQGLVDAARGARDRFSTLLHHSSHDPSSHSSHSSHDHHHASSADGMVCDKCLQPIDMTRFTANVASLEEQVHDAERALAAAQDNVDETQRTLQRIRTEMQRVRFDKVQLQREMQALSIQAAHEERQASVWRQEAMQAARSIYRAALLLHQWNHAWMTTMSTSSSDDDGDGRMGMHGGEEAFEQDLVNLLQNRDGGALQQLTNRVDAWTLRAIQHANQLAGAMVSYERMQFAENPHEQTFHEWSRLLTEKQLAVSTVQKQVDAAIEQQPPLAALVSAFGRSGIQSHLLESAIHELEALSNRHLEQLSDGFTLELRAFRVREAPTVSTRRRSTTTTKKDATTTTISTPTTPSIPPSSKPEVVEQVQKSVLLTLPTGDSIRRSLRQCSGGERKRLALALMLGYRDLVAHRLGVRLNVLVLDEVMQLLDDQGVRRAIRALQRMASFDPSRPQSVLLIAQADSLPAQEVEWVDWVIKRNGVSVVEPAAL